MCVCKKEREKEKYIRERYIESFQLQATGSEHPGLTSLASHALSYDISKLVTQLSNWREKLNKAPNSHDCIVNPDLTPCFCPWERVCPPFILVAILWSLSQFPNIQNIVF